MSQNEYEERKPIIYLAGIGMGQDDQLTGEVLDCLDRADAVMGARRMLDAAAPYTEGKAVLAAYKPSEMVNWLSSFEWDEAVLVLSGDTGFYSGAEAGHAQPSTTLATYTQVYDKRRKEIRSQMSKELYE